MTIRELIQLLGGQPWLLVGALVTPPLLALLLSLAVSREGAETAPWNWVYSVLVHFTCATGVLAAVLTAYTLFFTGESLLDVNAAVYVLPIVSMVVTLGLVRRHVSFRSIPGFDRLWGLMVMLAMTFVIVLVVTRTRIWLLFGGSIWTFVAMAAAVFAILEWGAHLAFRRRDEPRRDPPVFPTA